MGALEFRDQTLEIGYVERITLDKLFGPTIFAPLRIHADPERGWIIERMLGDRFEEWCVIPSQISSDFENRERV